MFRSECVRLHLEFLGKDDSVVKSLGGPCGLVEARSSLGKDFWLLEPDADSASELWRSITKGSTMFRTHNDIQIRELQDWKSWTIEESG